MARRPKTPGARKRPKRGARTPIRYTPEDTVEIEIAPLDAVFDRSAARVDQAPADTGREVAFAGRSNAGKSSALNRLSTRRGLARTSKTPGRTQLLNFFSVTEGVEEDAPARARLVDLPGYGYARTDIATRDAWQEHVEDYLARRESLVGLVLLMDVRHPFQPFDEHMLAWAEASDMPTLVLLNKADKLSKGAAGEAFRAAEGRLAALPKVRPVLFSALRGIGADTVLTVLRDWLALDADAAPGDAGTGAAPPVPE